jgi:hypothetical protein
MKIRIAFAAIALFAVASAFTTRTVFNADYQFLLDDGTRVQVDPTARTQGTGSGQYTCDNPQTSECAVISSVAPTQDPTDGNWYIDKSNIVSTVNGVYNVH